MNNRTVRLVSESGDLTLFTLSEPVSTPRTARPPASRQAFAAAHVVADPLDTPSGDGRARLDWDATLALRRDLWGLGFGVAEAMDTAQRGSGLDWPTALELIQRSARDARALGGRIVAGAQTDHCPPGSLGALDEVVSAYLLQARAIQSAGAGVVLMASRELARLARSPDDYATVYGRVLAELDDGVILHWLGPAFDPALAGYWGDADLDRATEACLDVLGAHAGRVAGIKLSLLDAGREIRMRRRLPEGVRMFTGDDFNFPELIAGDAEGHSDALLGVFDAIAPAAADAFARLDAGDPDGFRARLESCVPFARHAFAAPTYFYKTDLTFIAFLAGRQPHFRMIDGLEARRSIPHLCRLVVLADSAGLLSDPEPAARRLRAFLETAGIAQP